MPNFSVRVGGRTDLETASKLEAARVCRRQRRTRALGDVPRFARLLPAVNGGAEKFDEWRRT